METKDKVEVSENEVDSIYKKISSLAWKMSEVDLEITHYMIVVIAFLKMIDANPNKLRDVADFKGLSEYQAKMELQKIISAEFNQANSTLLNLWSRLVFSSSFVESLKERTNVLYGRIARLKEESKKQFTGESVTKEVFAIFNTPAGYTSFVSKTEGFIKRIDNFSNIIQGIQSDIVKLRGDTPHHVVMYAEGLGVRYVGLSSFVKVIDYICSLSDEERCRALQISYTKLASGQRDEFIELSTVITLFAKRCKDVIAELDAKIYASKYLSNQFYTNSKSPECVLSEMVLSAINYRKESMTQEVPLVVKRLSSGNLKLKVYLDHIEDLLKEVEKAKELWKDMVNKVVP